MLISKCIDCPCLWASDSIADTWYCNLGKFDIFWAKHDVDYRCPLIKSSILLEVKKEPTIKTKTITTNQTK